MPALWQLAGSTLPAPRTIAIGDIHGCLAALETLLAAIRPQPDDTIVLLGDYVDRGPNSRGVIERLLRLAAAMPLDPPAGQPRRNDAEGLRRPDGAVRRLAAVRRQRDAGVVRHAAARGHSRRPHRVPAKLPAVLRNRSGTSSFTATIGPSCRWTPSRGKRSFGSR